MMEVKLDEMIVPVVWEASSTSVVVSGRILEFVQVQDIGHSLSVQNDPKWMVQKRFIGRLQ
jgi:hypothetical protein